VKFRGQTPDYLNPEFCSDTPSLRFLLGEEDSLRGFTDSLNLMVIIQLPTASQLLAGSLPEWKIQLGYRVMRGLAHVTGPLGKGDFQKIAFWVVPNFHFVGHILLRFVSQIRRQHKCILRYVLYCNTKPFVANCVPI
jgi:hypothetical protein